VLPGDEAEVSSSSLAPWEKNVTRHGSVMTLAVGEAAPGSGKGGDDTSLG
jgi:hypothetical protein